MTATAIGKIDRAYPAKAAAAGAEIKSAKPRKWDARQVLRDPAAAARLDAAAASVDPLIVLTERAQVRALLWSIGELSDLPAAVDPLQHDAKLSGLSDRFGADAIQKIIAEAFAPYREKPAMTVIRPAVNDAAEAPLCPTCNWAPCLTPRFCRECRKADAKAAWDGRTAAKTKQPRPTPQVTVDAIIYSVRTRGTAALSEPATLERLSRCDDDAMAQIKRRLGKYTGNDDAI